MTYSIIGRDPGTGEIGAAVQSKFPGVGSIVLHGAADAGCLTTQAFSNPDHGAAGLELLRRGATAAETLAILLRNDDSTAQRQIAVLGLDGPPAAHTGHAVKGWPGWAGYATAPTSVAHGNGLRNERVAAEMADAFETSSGEIASRLIGALHAGEAAGGELRGLQSAGVLVVKPGGGYGGRTGRHVDISVYDHVEPIRELERCYGLHRLSYFPSDPADLMEIDGETARLLKRIFRLTEIADLPDTAGWDDGAIAAMKLFMGIENYDNRIRDDALIDREILQDIRLRYPGA